jgi:hypothetical protein
MGQLNLLIEHGSNLQLVELEYLHLKEDFPYQRILSITTTTILIFLQDKQTKVTKKNQNFLRGVLILLA